jgi:acyl carrier protein
MSEKREEIFKTITEHLEARGVDVSDVSPQSDLYDDLDLDSLETVELTLGLEERYGIEIPDSELEDVSTVNDAIDLIEQKLAAHA